MVKSVVELLDIVRKRIGDSTDDADISFIEDISDTLNAGNLEEVERLKSENEELRKKYRDRFFEKKEVKEEETEKDGKYIRQERYTGACSRSFYVGSEVNPAQVSAKFEDGILRISIPKAVKQLPQSTTVDIL